VDTIDINEILRDPASVVEKNFTTTGELQLVSEDELLWAREQLHPVKGAKKLEEVIAAMSDANLNPQNLAGSIKLSVDKAAYKVDDRIVMRVETQRECRLTVLVGPDPFFDTYRVVFPDGDNMDNLLKPDSARVIGRPEENHWQTFGGDENNHVVAICTPRADDLGITYDFAYETFSYMDTEKVQRLAEALRKSDSRFGFAELSLTAR
jgi:hypothetical protein